MTAERRPGGGAGMPTCTSWVELAALQRLISDDRLTREVDESDRKGLASAVTGAALRFAAAVLSEEFRYARTDGDRVVRRSLVRSAQERVVLLLLDADLAESRPTDPSLDPEA